MNIDTSDERDAILFKELDKHANKLRESAEKFADFIMQMKSKSVELKPIIRSLDAITSAKIEKMDQAISDLEKNILIFSTNIKIKNSTTMKEDEFIEFMKFYNELSNNAAQLVEKAIELNNS